MAAPAGASAATPVTPPAFGFSDTVWGSPDISHDTTLSWLADSGAKYVRTLVNWQYYEPQEGAYNANYLWGLYYEYADMRANGQTPIFVVLGTPYWALGDAGKGASKGSSLCADNNNTTQCSAPPNVRDDTIRAHWEMFVETLSYVMPNAVFEIWNEPNIDWFWLQPQDPALYGLMLKSAGEGVRLGSSTAKVISGSVNNYAGADTTANTNYTSFIKQMYATSGTSSFDGIGFHAYPCNNTPTTAGWTQAMTSAINGVRSARNAAGDNSKPLWLTETGANTGGVSPSNCGTSFTEQQQGKALKAILEWTKTQNTTSHDLPVALVYSLFDTHARTQATVDSFDESEFGLLSYSTDATSGAVTVAKKPAYATVSCEFHGGSANC